MTTSWGIFDTEDEVWIGDEHGPRLFTDKDIARVAAQMTDVRLGQKPGSRCACETRRRPAWDQARRWRAWRAASTSEGREGKGEVWQHDHLQQRSFCSWSMTTRAITRRGF